MKWTVTKSPSRSSIVGPGTFIDHDAHVTNSILFPGVTIGSGARLNRCIVDKNVVIPDFARIGFDAEQDSKQFTISDNGIVVIAKGQPIN